MRSPESRCADPHRSPAFALDDMKGSASVHAPACDSYIVDVSGCDTDPNCEMAMVPDVSVDTISPISGSCTARSQRSGRSKTSGNSKISTLPTMIMIKSWKEVCPSNWGITKEDLIEFEAEVRKAWKEGIIPDDPDRPNPYHNDPKIGPNIYQVCKYFIRPRTRDLEAAAATGGGTSWALLKHPEGHPCDVFASHSWSEGIFEFTEQVLRIWPPKANGLYCCFLSNPQNGNVAEMLGSDPLSSPFARALSRCKYFLVIPNQTVSIYSRLWCVFEAHLALQQHKKIILLRKTINNRKGLALVLFGLTCFLTGFSLSTPVDPQRYVFQKFRVCDLAMTIAMILLPSRVILLNAITERMPLRSSGSCLTTLGFLFGIDRPFFGLCTCRLMSLIYLLLVWGAIQRMARVYHHASKNRSKNKLGFGSVQDATCTNPTDAFKISEVVRGNEMHIDGTISLLKRIGRFDKTVARNLAWGLSPTRARDGVLLPFVLAYSIVWCMGLLCWVDMHRLARWSVALGLSLVVTFCIKRVGNRATFLTDAITFGAMIMFVSYQLLEMHYHGQAFPWSKDGGPTCSAAPYELFILVWLLAFFAVTVCCLLFYTGFFSKFFGSSLATDFVRQDSIMAKSSTIPTDSTRFSSDGAKEPEVQDVFIESFDIVFF